MKSPSAKTKSAETKAAAKAIMDLIPEDTTEAVLASVKRQVAMRLNKLRADGLETKPRRSVTLREFDVIMSTLVPGYRMPVGELPPGQMIQASRILESAGIDKARAEDFATWIANEGWYMQDPSQGRALNAIPRNILTAVRYGEYLRKQEELQMVEIYAGTET